MNPTSRIADSVRAYQSAIEKMGAEIPKLHAVLGSGIGSSFEESWIPAEWKEAGAIPFSDLSALSSATSPGHPGVYRIFVETKTGRSLCLQVGRLHGYEGLTARDTSLSVMIPRLAGTKNFILTNAAGGLKHDWPVGSIMMIRDHVNLTGQNPLVGPVMNDLEGNPLGPRFPGFLAQAWNRHRTELLRKELAANGLETHEGVYLGILGPNFETPAEVRLFSQWGLGTVGMSTVWEAIALVHSGAELSGFSLITNLGCGLNPGVVLDHFQILEASRGAARKIVASLFRIAARENASR